MVEDVRRFVKELRSIHLYKHADLPFLVRAKIKEAADLIESLYADLCAFEDVAESPGWVEDMARENYRLSQERDEANKKLRAVEQELKDLRYEKSWDDFPERMGR